MSPLAGYNRNEPQPLGLEICPVGVGEKTFAAYFAADPLDVFG